MPSTTWFGFGVKYGGSLAVVGVESMQAIVWRLNDDGAFDGALITSQGFRTGIGLGGGVGLCAILLLNIHNPSDIERIDSSDWGINIVLGPATAQIDEWALRSQAAMTAVAQLGNLNGIPLKIRRLFRHTNPNDLKFFEEANGAFNKGRSGFSLGAATAAPSAIMLDLPGAGVELSANYVWGTSLEIYDLFTTPREQTFPCTRSVTEGYLDFLLSTNSANQTGIIDGAYQIGINKARADATVMGSSTALLTHLVRYHLTSRRLRGSASGGAADQQHADTARLQEILTGSGSATAELLASIQANLRNRPSTPIRDGWNDHEPVRVTEPIRRGPTLSLRDVM